MVDEELKNYIYGLMKEGYDLDSIKDALIKAGHKINKVENLSLYVFEMFHKDLLNYIDDEIDKGRDIDNIKKDLLKLGHSEDKLKQIIKYHGKKGSFKKRLKLNDVIQREKRWLKSWLIIYFYIFLGIIILFGIVFIIFGSPFDASKQMTFSEKEEICDSLSSEVDLSQSKAKLYSSLCKSMLHKDSMHCNKLDADSYDSCNDLFLLYTFYQNKNKALCDGIKDYALKEYCYQLSEMNCNDYLGYGKYCRSITNSAISKCISDSPSPEHSIIGRCQENFRFYFGVRYDDEYCGMISNPGIKNICFMLTGSSD